METIGNVIYAHRHYWDCFKYNIFHKENLPKIHYNFFGEKPEIYQTRNMYPKFDTSDFDIILNNIITGIVCYAIYFDLTIYNKNNNGTSGAIRGVRTPALLGPYL